MSWIDISRPTDDGSPYSHTTLSTPIGEFMISWKNWKEHPDYSIFLNGQFWGSEQSLDNAKERVIEILKAKRDDLKHFLFVLLN